MTRHLVLSFRFLSPWFHGRGDDGTAEWPPSPLRVFQALVAAAARAGSLEAARDALAWLERRAAPLVIATEGAERTTGYRLSVPHNAMDLVGRQWSRGDEGSAAEHRTMKNVRPLRLPEDAAVHYAWPIGDDASSAPPLVAAAGGVVALGWGVDLVVGDGAVVDAARLDELAATLKVWQPRSDGRCRLRVPTAGTLQDLEARHAAFLVRTSVDDPTLRPPPPLSTFQTTRYARADQQRLTEIAGFTLMRVDADGLRAFDTARRGMAVAGMLRHAVRSAAERAGWDAVRVHASVLGHGSGAAPRLLLVPVPSIEPRGIGAETAGAVRRVMLFSTDAQGNDTAWAARVLGGMDLIDEQTGEVQAVLAAASRDDRVLLRYVAEARTWVTVSPMVLPGHDDPGGVRARLRKMKHGERRSRFVECLMKRREALVRKALLHAGFGHDLVNSVEVDIRETGFIAGVEMASRYAVPRHLANAPRLHVKLIWPERVAGPLCIGRGRFSGVGLFVAIPD